MIKVSFDLTEDQLKEAMPITKALEGKQGAVLGQAWLVPSISRPYGQADFYYLTAAQYAHVNTALLEALKMKEDDS